MLQLNHVLNNQALAHNISGRGKVGFHICGDFVAVILVPDILISVTSFMQFNAIKEN